jgi:hypothetical protein
MLCMRNYIHAFVAAGASAATTFNPATGSEQLIVLFKNNPTITVDTVLADLVLADFGGYAAIECGAGAPGVYMDPATGQWEIRPVEPAGGFEWVVDADDNLPQSIYGFALLNNAGTTLVAAEKFDAPKVLTAQNQVVDVPQPKLKLAFVPLT